MTQLKNAQKTDAVPLPLGIATMVEGNVGGKPHQSLLLEGLFLDPERVKLNVDAIQTGKPFFRHKLFDNLSTFEKQILLI